MFQAFDRFQLRLFAFLDRFVQRKYWLFELVLFTFFFDLFVGFPSFDLFRSDFIVSWKHIYYHSEHILEPLPFPPGSHESKMTFRLFVPVLVWLSGLPPAGIIALKFGFGFLLLLLFARLTWKITGDQVQSCLFTLAFGCINTPKCAFDISGMVDTFAYFFLVLPLLYRHAPVVFLSVFLAAWVDERGLIASSLVLLFLWFHQRDRRVVLSLAVLLAWAAYFGIRFYLSAAYGLSTPHEDISFMNLVKQISTIGLGIWGALEGMWLVVIAAAIYLIRERNYLQVTVFAGGVILILGVASLVYDITRSMNYAFPAFLVALPVLVSNESRAAMRQIAFLVLLFSFLYPAYVVGGTNYVVWQFPMPLQLIRMLFL